MRSAGPQRDRIGQRALKFPCVLDQDDPGIDPGHLGEQRIGERGLARTGASSDEDVGALGHRCAKRVCLGVRHQPVSDIVIKGVQPLGWLADREAGGGRDGGKQAFEALAGMAIDVRRQLRRDDWLLPMHLGAGMRRNQPDDALDLCRLHPHIRIGTSLAESVETERAVGVDHDFDDLDVAHGGGDVGPKRRDEHAPATCSGKGGAHWPSS